jgi:hypothetical protein
MMELFKSNERKQKTEDKTMMEANDADELDALLAGVEPSSGALAESLLESLTDDEGDGVSVADDVDADLAALADEAPKAPSPPSIDKQTFYDEQESTIGVADTKSAAPKKVKAAKKTAAAKEPKGPQGQGREEGTEGPRSAQGREAEGRRRSDHPQRRLPEEGLGRRPDQAWLQARRDR